MKRFENFIKEDYDKNEREESIRRLEARKVMKTFIEEYITTDIDDIKIIKVKPWSDDIEIILRFTGDYFYNKTDPKSFKRRLNKTLQQVESIEKILNTLNIEFNVKQLANSSDIEIDLNLHNDYFEVNKDILSSLKGINKFSL